MHTGNYKGEEYVKKIRIGNVFVILYSTGLLCMGCTQGDTPEFFFIYLGKENIYTLKTRCTISV